MEKEYNEYLWSPKQPRVYEASPLAISGTPMSEEDLAMLSKVENLQQKFQQDPIVKRSKQWEMQQKQREEEIATSKKWLELHPEDESDSPYTILERGKHQAIIDGKDPSYYEKMINDGEQFTKGALSVLSLPYLAATAAGAYGYGASLGARGLFAGQGIYGLANENGIRKTANLIKSGDYGKAALSGAENALNAAMILPGAKFLRNVAKYGIKSTVAGDMLAQNVRYNAPNMETVADYTNKQTFDNLMKYPDKEYNNIPVYLDHNTLKIKKVKNPELVKFEFWPNKFGEPVQLKKATDEFGNEVFLHSFDRNQGRYVDNTPLNMDQKFIHYRASEGYDGKTLFPKADNKVDPVGHIWFNANYSAHSFPDAYKSEHFAIDPIPSTSHSWSKSFRLVSDPVDVSNAIHTKYNPITLGLETQIKPFTPPKNSATGKTSYAFFERPSKLSEAELKGVPKSVRNQPYKPTTWLQGDDAIKMFNDYGGMDPIVDNSPLMERIVKYVPEARERYGLVGNTNISDETIAKALYKKAFQLSGNDNGAVNEFGEPLVLFRGDTKRYPVLKPRMSPEELATKSGTMDNSLGTLFLDYPNHYQGLDRYIGTARYFNGNGQLVNSGTGSKIIGGERPMQTIDGIQLPPVGSRLLYSGVWGKNKYPISVFKLPASEMESGVNDINAFVVRSPKVRDATSEISVLSDDFLAQGGSGKNYYGKSRIVYDENGFPEFLHSDGTRTPALAGNENRLGMAEHYRYVLNDAKAKQQGLLKSNKGSILRDEHSGYDYYALPNFNIRGAKHLLGYDLNYPLENSWSLYRKQGGILKRK